MTKKHTSIRNPKKEKKKSKQCELLRLRRDNVQANRMASRKKCGRAPLRRLLILGEEWRYTSLNKVGGS